MIVFHWRNNSATPSHAKYYQPCNSWQWLKKSVPKMEPWEVFPMDQNLRFATSCVILNHSARGSTQLKGKRVSLAAWRSPVPAHRLRRSNKKKGVWVQIAPPGIGPQVLVHVSTYQGSILGTYV